MPSSSINTTRRGFLQTSLAAGAMIAGGALPATLARNAFAMQDKAAKPMKILILGGSQFIGPALVDLSRKRGHSITVFNRGITEKKKGSLGDDVERIVGDRDPDKGEGIKGLAGKKWDVCIDDSGYYPRHVKAVAEMLAPNIRQYIFVSSISAYADNSKVGQDESAELAKLDDPTTETMTGAAYGGLKVLCEQAAEAACSGRTTIVRPGFIVGPGDPTDRFTWWPWRVQHSGQDDYGMEMLAPGTPDDPMQVIDVRDLAAFLLKIAEDNTIGVFNACGPAASDHLSIGKLLDASKRACAKMGPAGGKGAESQLTWVSGKFIEEYNRPLAEEKKPEMMIDTTIWIPPEGESIGFHQWSNAAAVKAGMTFTPIEKTVVDTLEWFPKELERRVRVSAEMVADAKAKGEPEPKIGTPGKIRTGTRPEAEKLALEAWHKQEQGAKTGG